MFWLGNGHECELRSESLPQSVGSSVTVRVKSCTVKIGKKMLEFAYS
jgi:hypothetical protein